MNNTYETLIEKLGLLPHPEGGWYRETYRSNLHTGERQLMTSIYFLLTSENVSRFHRIKSDELWYFHAGSTLIVHTLKEDGYHGLLLGNKLEAGEEPQLLVEAGTIFGSSLKDPDAFALVSCAVAPGFDFRDFELFEAEPLLEKWPEHEAIIRKLT